MRNASELDELFAFANVLADAARAAILPHFRAGILAENKAAIGFDPVTIADKAAEAAMRALIQGRYPDHSIHGEEYADQIGTSPWQWVLDPIDGTRAFIAGLPTWGVLIGLTYLGTPCIGILDQPFTGERFRGRPEGSDWVRFDERIILKTRDQPLLTQATLTTTDPIIFTPAEKGAFDQVRATARLTRFGLDCYGYGMVAMGNIDLVVEAGLKAVDIVACIPIIEGAGGCVVDWRGNPTAHHGGQALAVGDRRLIDQALVALRRSAT